MYEKQWSPESSTNASSPAMDLGPEDNAACDLMGNAFVQGLLQSGGDQDVTAEPADLMRSIFSFGGGEEDVCEAPVAPEVCEAPAEATPEDLAESAEVCVEEAPQDVQVEAADAANTCLDGEGPTPEEQLASAQVAREGLEAQLTGLDRLPAERRDAILARVRGLEGPALVAEMETISHALSTPNASRALGAYAEIQAMIDEDPERAARLDHDTVDMLVRGVADRRGESDRAQEGVLNVRSATDAARGLLNMNDEQYAETRDLLRRAGTDAEGNAVAGADPHAEQALILKAVAARRDHTDQHWYDGALRFFGSTSESDDNLADIRTFANDIRGEERTELIRTTSTLDLHDTNDSTVDPNNLAANNDTTNDNDGWYQRFGDSCGPTTSQIVRGEADPIYARALHDEGFTDPDPHSTAAEEQQRVLEANDGTAVARLGTQARGSMTGTMNTMIADGSLTTDQRDLINDLANDEVEDDDRAAAEAALETVRARNGGHPTDAELAAMQEDAGESGDGMVLDPALQDITRPGTHIDYSGSWVGNAGVGGNLDDMETRLEEGEDVPFRIGYTNGGGHFMSVTDVRRDSAGARSFLVADPWTGASRWVSEADFSSGAFTQGTFPLGQATVTHVYTGNHDE